jgi:hypothetical protein
VGSQRIILMLHSGFGDPEDDTPLSDPNELPNDLEDTVATDSDGNTLVKEEGNRIREGSRGVLKEGMHAQENPGSAPASAPDGIRNLEMSEWY